MRRLDQDDRAKVGFSFEGVALTARQGDSVAAALLVAEQSVFRQTPVSGTARGPYCMMGVCYDCLVEIDGVGNVQACMTEVREGMRVMRQIGAKDILAPVPEDRANQ